MSSFLFIITIELLTILIRSNDQIEGIETDGHTFKLTMFADDVCSVLKYSANSLHAISQTFSYCETVAGLKINYDKTEVLRIGSLRNSEAELYCQKPLHWTNDPVIIFR